MSDEEKSGGGVAATVGAIAGAGAAGTYMFNREANAMMTAARTDPTKAGAMGEVVEGILAADKGKQLQNRAINLLSKEGAKIQAITLKRITESTSIAAAGTAGEEKIINETATIVKPAADGLRVRFEGDIAPEVGHVEVHGVKNIPALAQEPLKTEPAYAVENEGLKTLTEKGGWKDKIVATAEKDLNKDLRASDAFKKAGGSWKFMEWKGGRGKVIGTAIAGAAVVGLGAKALFSGKKHAEAVATRREQAAEQQPAR